MDPIVLAFGTALVGAMATDMWQQARASVVALWLRVHPQQADTVEADLEGFAWPGPRRPPGGLCEH